MLEMDVNDDMAEMEGERKTYSWSLNREYSSSPTLTGDPPYCE